MAQLKCTECGQIFDGNLADCPNCGCPASECEVVEECKSQQQKESRQGGNPFSSRNNATHRETGNGVMTAITRPSLIRRSLPLRGFVKTRGPLRDFPKAVWM